MMITDTNYGPGVITISGRQKSLLARLWAEVVFEYHVLRLRRQIARDLKALPDRLLEDIGTFRGEIASYSDRAARHWIECQLARTGRYTE